MEYTDEQLKQALAKMLPNDVEWIKPHLKTSRPYLVWISSGRSGEFVENTELLHLCWLVEETLNQFQCEEYYSKGVWYHSTWQEKIVNLAEVKGIEI